MALCRAGAVAERCDTIHSHVETQGFLFAEHAPVPVLTTLHGRLDLARATQYIDAMPSIPLVALTDSQRRWNPDANWLPAIPPGIDFPTPALRRRPAA